MRRLVVAGLVIAVLATSQFAYPVAANAHGAIAPPPDANVTVTGERAVVNWDGANESIVMMLDMVSSTEHTGLIIPTPNPATVTPGSTDLFDTLDQVTKPVAYVADDWFGTSLLPGTAPSAAPSVLQRVQLGPIEATTLAASDADGLRVWLTDNNFVISSTVEAALANYVSLGWSLVALKLTGTAPLNGLIDPIRLEFPTTQLVYPTLLSYPSDHARDLRLYILDKQRNMLVQENSPTVSLDADVTVVWAGSLVHPVLLQLGRYLTVVDVHFADPKLQVTDDIGIIASGDQENVQPRLTHFRVISLLGIPVGSLIVGWALLGTALLVVLGVWRRRAS
jgi:hypothetical protein